MKQRLSRTELEQWKQIPVAVISDEQGHKGIVHPEVRLVGGGGFAGQALTIRTIEKANPAAHWTINLAEPGDVIMIDGRAYPDSAIWGGNMIFAAAARGVSGLVVDGNVRDGDDLRASGVAVYARRVQAVGWHWGGVVNEPIECGGAQVEYGDLVVGDSDGIAIVGLEGREALLGRCHERMAADESLRAQIRQGKSTIEILKLPPFSKGRQQS
jgi:4-hydroxy-4-methyl-2-oxoglutarate aldolase